MEKTRELGLVNGRCSSSPKNPESGVHNDVIDLTFGSNGVVKTTCNRSENDISKVQNDVHISKYSLDPKIKQLMSSVEVMRAEVMSHILKDIEQGVNGMLAFSNSVPGFTELNKGDKASLLKSKFPYCWCCLCVTD